MVLLDQEGIELNLPSILDDSFPILMALNDVSWGVGRKEKSTLTCGQSSWEQ
jgi:hypothetical protein